MTMTTAHAPARGGLAETELAQKAPLLLVALFAAVHLMMAGYDLWHPEPFLHADRATERIYVIEQFGETWRAGGDIGAYLAAHGIIGDWLPQALLYLAGGRLLVIAAQVLLVLASIVAVRDIGLRLGLGAGRATAAAVLYGFLPHTLVFPHQLASEALAVPLVVLSFAFCVRAVTPRPQAGGGLLIGLSTLVRPVTMLWPFVYAASARLSLRARAAYLVAALAPLLLWMGFVYAETGVFSMGESGHDLKHNLYGRAARMVTALPEPERSSVKLPADGTMSLGAYGRFVLDHPGEALAHSARDLAAIGLKSGVERITLDYVDLFPDSRRALQDGETGWRARVEQEGPVRALIGIFRENPALILVSAAGSALFVVFMALAVLGAVRWLRDDAPPDTYRFRLILIGFVLYIAAVAQSVDAVQSRQRAPAEFALCLLAVSALPLRRRRKDTAATR